MLHYYIIFLFQRDDELDTDHVSSFLCIIPGMEGHHHRYRLMCESLKMRAIVLQPGLDKPNESLQEMTQRFAEVAIISSSISIPTIY